MNLENTIKGREALRDGRKAERYLLELIGQVLNEYGISLVARLATAQEDMGGGKTDIVISDFYGSKLKIQVSLKPKSKRARKNLARKGVIPLSILGKKRDTLEEEIHYLLRKNFDF